IIFANRAAESLLGYPQKGLLGRLLGEIFPGVGEAEGSFSVEGRRGDGAFESLTIDLSLLSRSGDVLRVAHLSLASSNRQEAASEQASHRTLEAIVRHAPVGMSYFDSDLRFVLINEALAKISGHPVEAHIGRRVEELGLGAIPLVVEDLKKVLS